VPNLVVPSHRLPDGGPQKKGQHEELILTRPIKIGAALIHSPGHLVLRVTHSRCCTAISYLGPDRTSQRGKRPDQIRSDWCLLSERSRHEISGHSTGANAWRPFSLVQSNVAP